MSDIDILKLLREKSNDISAHDFAKKLLESNVTFNMNTRTDTGNIFNSAEENLAQQTGAEQSTIPAGSIFNKNQQQTNTTQTLPTLQAAQSSTSNSDDITNQINNNIQKILGMSNIPSNSVFNQNNNIIPQEEQQKSITLPALGSQPQTQVSSQKDYDNTLDKTSLALKNINEAANEGDENAQNVERLLSLAQGAFKSLTGRMSNTEAAKNGNPMLSQFNTISNALGEKYPNEAAIGKIIGTLPLMTVGDDLSGVAGLSEWAGNNVGRQIALSAANGALNQAGFTAASDVAPVVTGQTTPQEALKDVGIQALVGGTIGGGLGALGAKSTVASKLAPDMAATKATRAAEADPAGKIDISNVSPQQELEVYQEAIKANPEKAAANGWDKYAQQLQDQISSTPANNPSALATIANVFGKTADKLTTEDQLKILQAAIQGNPKQAESNGWNNAVDELQRQLSRSQTGDIKTNPDFYVGNGSGMVTNSLDEQPKLLSETSSANMSPETTKININQGNSFLPISNSKNTLTDYESNVLDNLSKNPQNYSDHVKVLGNALNSIKTEYDKTLNSLTDYVKNYKGKGIKRESVLDEQGNIISNKQVNGNDDWYRQIRKGITQQIKENASRGQKSSSDLRNQITKGIKSYIRSNAHDIAVGILNDEDESGHLYDRSLTGKMQFYKDEKPFYDNVLAKGNITNVSKDSNGYNINYGLSEERPREKFSAYRVTPVEYGKSSAESVEKLSDIEKAFENAKNIPEVGESGLQAMQNAKKTVFDSKILDEVEKQYDALPEASKTKLSPQGADILDKAINGDNQNLGFTAMPEVTNTGIKVNNVLGDKANIIEKLDKDAFKSDAVNSPIANVQRYRVSSTIGGNAYNEGVIANGERLTRPIKDVINPKIKITNEQANDIFKGLENDTREYRNNPFAYYLDLNHNVNRLAEEKPVLPLDVEQSKAAIAKMDAISPKFKQALEEYKATWNKFMEVHAIGKTISQEDYNAFAKKYPNYVPTFRDFSRDATGSLYPSSGYGMHLSSGNVMKEATGSTRALKPLDQRMQARINQVVKVETRNDLYRSIIATALKDPEGAGKLVRVLSAEPEEVTNALKESVKNGDEIVGLDRIGSRVFEVNGQKVHTITAMINGKPVTAQIAPQIFDSLKFLDNPKDIGKGTNFLRMFVNTPTRLLKATATEYNPTFLATNALRDLSTALIQTEAPAGKFMKYYAQAVKEMATRSKNYLDFLSLGGRGAGFYKNLGVNDLTPGRLIAKAIYAPFKGLGKASEAVEMAPRFAEYLATVEKGGGTYASKLRGIYNAAEITTNFARTTPVLQTIDAFVPYFNASQQGLNKFLSVCKAHPFRTVMRGAAVITVPTAILYAINNSNPNYQSLDSYVKNNYFCIPNYSGSKDKNGNPETFIKLPKNREYGLLLGTTFQWMADSLQGKTPSKDEISQQIENILPSNPLTENVLSPAVTFAQGVSGNNDVRNWNGSRIIPQSEAGKVMPKDQYDATTSGVAKRIGQATNISPRLIDYLGSSYLGGYSNGIKGVTSEAQNPSTKNPVNSMIVNKFTADSAYNNSANDKFYNALNQWEQQTGSDKKNGSPTYGKSRSNYLMLSRFNTSISKLYDQAKAAENKGNMETARVLRQRISNIQNYALSKIKG